ncbi:large ribosomal subunit protein mL49-like [Mytilus galloprovincialis]|uniref:large ribosomal subunit protein mL49-like n=1 Tax=Mytilus galloprovincialis TaxID=29158 RepID=UPI003F7C6126
MAASMKNFRLIFRILQRTNIQPHNTIYNSAPCQVSIKYLYTAEQLPPKDTLTQFEESTEEFKFVEKILPRRNIPDLPVHTSYPTPSGWVPPDREKTKDLPYSVERNKNHNLPVYVKQTTLRGTKITTVINRVHGDIWQFEKDLKSHIEETVEMRFPLLTEVSEVTRRVTLKGNHVELAGRWLIDKGF